MVAQTEATPTSVSVTVARMGMITSELTAKVSPAPGPVMVTSGGFGSWRMATLFCCVTVCVGSTSSAFSVSATVLPPARFFAVATVKLRLVVWPLTTGEPLLTVPLVAVSASDVMARSSVAAASTAIVPPAYICRPAGATSKRSMTGGVLATMVNVDGVASAVRPARSRTCTLNVAVPATALNGTFSAFAGVVVVDSGKA